MEIEEFKKLDLKKNDIILIDYNCVSYGITIEFGSVVNKDISKKNQIVTFFMDFKEADKQICPNIYYLRHNNCRESRYAHLYLELNEINSIEILRRADET